MRVGFAGLGRMGSGMAGRLLDAGFDVCVWNRTSAASAPLAERGARVAGTPREAAEGADAVLCMVADDEASRSIWLGPDGVLAGQIGETSPDGSVAPRDRGITRSTARAEGEAQCAPLAIECSTLSHGWVMELSGRAAASGWRYLDCPVTGLPDAAASGLLTLLVGADPDDLNDARPLLDPLSDKLIRFGGVGTGTAYKLIVNLLGAIQIGSAAEALALAERAGLDLDQVVDALATSQAASPQVVRTTRRMLAADADAEVTFSGRLRHKDAAYALALASEIGAAAPFGAQALAGLDQLLAAGRGDVNETAIIEVARDGRPGATAIRTD